MSDDQPFSAADLGEGTQRGPAVDAWLAANPALAAEVAIAARTRLLLSQLAAAEIAVPDDFEARLMERLRADTTLLELLDLGLSGWGSALLELLAALFTFLPAPQPASA